MCPKHWENRHQANIGPFPHGAEFVVWGDRSTKNQDNILKYYENSFSFSENLVLPRGPFTVKPDEESKADCPKEEKTQKNPARTESDFWLRIQKESLKSFHF